MRLTDRERDGLRGRINDKLLSIQPLIDPTAYRVECHDVLRQGVPISDVFVIQVSRGNLRKSRWDQEEAERPRNPRLGHAANAAN